MITIYWHCLGTTACEEGEKFVAGALDQLAQHLKGEQVKLSINIKRLGDEPKLAKKVDEILDQSNDQSNPFSTYYEHAIVDALYTGNCIGIKNTSIAKLLVYCSPDSNIAVAAKRQNPHAKYGAMCSFLAAVYSLNKKSTIFHEALHLLGADECYIEDKPSLKKPDCNFKRCIMNFEPREEWCEKWPFICVKNIKLIC